MALKLFPHLQNSLHFTKAIKQFPPMEEIATAYIIEKCKSRIVPLYDYSELKIVDEVLGHKKDKGKQNLNRFLQPKERSSRI